MTDVDLQELRVMPKLVLGIGALLIVAGAIWHGITVMAVERFWRDLPGRPSGPMSFRSALQPSTYLLIRGPATRLTRSCRSGAAGRIPMSASRYHWCSLEPIRGDGALQERPA
jgi:hypothetical protein